MGEAVCDVKFSLADRVFIVSHAIIYQSSAKNFNNITIVHNQLGQQCNTGNRSLKKLETYPLGSDQEDREGKGCKVCKRE